VVKSFILYKDRTMMRNTWAITVEREEETQWE